MKNKIFILLLLFLSASCSESFLENAPEDSLVVDNYYNTNEQVMSAGAPLYGYPWFYFNEKFLICIGDNYSGNSTGTYSDIAQFTLFSVNQGNQFATEGWDALYNVIATANTLIYNLETKVSGDVDEDVIEEVKGEAYFMRATAYFYLVRTWGAVPIIYTMDQYNADTEIYRNTVEDVYTFILNDYNRALSRVPIQRSDSESGRVTQTACNAMMAKVYLTLEDYTNAKTKAELVINSGVHGLLENFGDVFHPSNNNSRESIFALQWVANQGWGYQNPNQAYLAASPKLTNAGDGWGTFQPSIDFQNAFEDGDLRKHETIMEPGDFYSDLVTSEGGYTVPESGMTSTIAAWRKYVVGSKDEWENVGFMSTDMNTYIMRYAEVLLIHAEAILGTNASTSDSNALESFNAVRKRAGLDEKSSITFDDILQERRVEFAVEGKYWYDLARMDRTKALAIISNQERGDYVDGNYNDIITRKVTPSAGDFLLPIPGSEADLNPLLLEEPVPFDFNN
nr:RagB/SusD family nutrient uptake outer membrane protein [uncultured Marinifilum sp.]